MEGSAISDTQARINASTKTHLYVLSYALWVSTVTDAIASFPGALVSNFMTWPGNEA